MENIYQPLSEKVSLILKPKKEKAEMRRKGNIIQQISEWIGERFSLKERVEITIHEASPKKIIEFMKLMIEESKNFRETMEKNFDVDVEIMKVEDYISAESCIGAIDEVLGFIAHSDKMMEIILEGIDENIIPNLTINQRLAIFEAFRSVNPILTDAEKKVVESAETWAQALQKVAQEEINKELLKKKTKSS